MKKLQIFGDSILRGVMYSGEEGKYRLCEDSKMTSFKEYGIEVSNHSKMGSTIEGGAKLMQSRLGACGPDTTVLIEFGGNDCDFNWEEISNDPGGEFHCRMPEAQFINIYKSAVEYAREKGAEVAAALLVPLDPDKYFRWISRNLNPDNIMKWLGDKNILYRWQEYYSSLVKQIAVTLSCPIVDLRTPFLTSHNYNKLLCDDGIHPTAEGHRIIKKEILSFCIGA